VLFGLNTYPLKQGGEGRAGVELFPSKDFNLSPSVTASNLKIYNEHHRIKFNLDLTFSNKEDIPKLFHPGCNTIFMYIDERHNNQEGFCFIEMKNFDLFEIHDLKNNKFNIKGIVKGFLLNGKDFFQLGRNARIWFKRFKVKIYGRK